MIRSREIDRKSRLFAFFITNNVSAFPQLSIICWRDWVMSPMYVHDIPHLSIHVEQSHEKCAECDTSIHKLIHEKRGTKLGKVLKAIAIPSRRFLFSLCKFKRGIQNVTLYICFNGVSTHLSLSRKAPRQVNQRRGKREKRVYLNFFMLFSKHRCNCGRNIHVAHRQAEA